MGARETALRVLMSCRNNHAWADAALKAQLGRDGLVGPEAALCSRLVYGVVQNQQLLDFYLSAYCSQKPDHLQPPLPEIFASSTEVFTAALSGTRSKYKI